MKLLVVLEAVHLHPLPRLLRMLGIDFAIAYLDGDLQTPHGRFAWNNDSAIRAYLRRYDAVLVGVRGNLLSSTPPIFRSFRWLGWNEPNDPPVAYVGLDPRANFAALSDAIPADFPLLRPNPSDTANTLFAFPTGNYIRTAGLRVRLTRENVELYIPCAIAQATTLWEPNDGYLYRLDLAKHAALAGAGEILAVPVREDIDFPNDVVCAYRYKNRYLLPMVVYQNWLNPLPLLRGTFWALYALKLLGVRPAYSIPLFMVMDDALMLYISPNPAPAGMPTYAQFARIGYETYRYWAEEFYPRTGCAMVCGLLTGGRYRSGYGEHWKLVQLGRWINETLDTATREQIRQWHALLLKHHAGGLPCTIHDHTLELRANRTHSGFVRHNDAGFAHAAPNDVPLTRGTTLVRQANAPMHPPAGAQEREIGGERYWEWGFTTSGTGTTLSTITPNNLYAARLMWESAVVEMLALGFPDAHGGNDYRLMISPNNFTGDVPTWRAIRELGYQAVRCHLPRSVHTPPDTNPAPWHGIVEGLHLLSTIGVDGTGVFELTLGLFYAGYPNHTAVGFFGLDVNGDITQQWASNRVVAAQRAYRRYVAMATEYWLQSAFGTIAVMAHPNVILGWADPNDPVRPFDPADPRVGGPSINFLLELAWNMEKVVAVLAPYLKWGTVREYVALRERVLSG
ncbi:MAG: hypothetical protein NZ550_01235 [Fimbriimonadales bacterium]|nr:hypothetical protein [Fimbriimonadales bacterium]MDW8051436.1 hypothetical protein [Armatimonadota bacterium]